MCTGLGPGTIVGSAAFNLYPILAVCVLVPKAGVVKRIEKVGVWIVELVWSFWAYIWLAIILQVSNSKKKRPLENLDIIGVERGWTILWLLFQLAMY